MSVFYTHINSIGREPGTNIQCAHRRSCTILINGRKVCVHDGAWKECEVRIVLFNAYPISIPGFR